MLTLVRSSQFGRDIKRAQKRGRNLGKLRTLLGILIGGGDLPASCRDHPLKGDWKGYRDLHIEADWLLIYRISGDELHLVRTGSHSDLFKE